MNVIAVAITLNITQKSTGNDRVTPSFERKLPGDIRTQRSNNLKKNVNLLILTPYVN